MILQEQHAFVRVSLIPKIQMYKSRFLVIVTPLESATLRKSRSTKTRIIELSIVAENLFKQLSSRISRHDFFKELIGPLPGRDTVSLFSEEGKLKAI